MLEMRNLLNKKLNKKGFTLAELLVVVAILAVLVAVSIPIFTGKLDEAKKNTDLANVRAAKGEAVTEYLSNGRKTLTNTIYDAENGKMVSTLATGYNKYEDKTDARKTGENSCYIVVSMNTEVPEDISVTCTWTLAKSQAS